MKWFFITWLAFALCLVTNIVMVVIKSVLGAIALPFYFLISLICLLFKQKDDALDLMRKYRQGFIEMNFDKDF